MMLPPRHLPPLQPRPRLPRVRKLTSIAEGDREQPPHNIDQYPDPGEQEQGASHGQSEDAPPCPPSLRTDSAIYDDSEWVAERTRRMILDKLRHLDNETNSMIDYLCEQQSGGILQSSIGESVSRDAQQSTNVNNITCNARTRLNWKRAAFRPLIPSYPNSISAMQFAFDQLSFMHKSLKTKFDIISDIRYLATRVFGCSETENGHEERTIPNIPCSLYRVEQLIGLQDHTMYEIHVCTTRDCPWWWWGEAGLSDHAEQCTDINCEICRCSLCHARRFKEKTKPGTRADAPVQRAWFFPDVFQAFFYNKTWAVDVQKSRRDRSAVYYCSPDCHRVTEMVATHCDTSDVMFFELSADGVPIHRNHSSIIYMLRSKDSSPTVEATLDNLQPVLVIPGPYEPVGGLDVFTHLILNLFAMFGPAGRSQLTVRSPPVNSAYTTGNMSGNNSGGTNSRTRMAHTVFETQRVVPILTGLVADYPMRAKLTHWMTPGAKHNGGWCMCGRKHQVDPADPKKLIDGYSWTIPQRFLQYLNVGRVGKKREKQDSVLPHAHIGDPRMKLSETQLIQLGNEARKIQKAVTDYDNRAMNPGGSTALQRACVYNKSNAKHMLSVLGRTGALPWASPIMLRDLPYIRLSSFCLIPIAHLFLHGIMKTFLWHCFQPGTEWEATPIAFTHAQKGRVRELWGRIHFPHANLGTDKCPVDSLPSFKMQDCSTVLWTASLICVHAPNAFTHIWLQLRRAMVHYMYGYNATHDDFVMARNAIRNFARELEQLVLGGLAPRSLLVPNLHIAYCRLYDQEVAHGPAARANELWMERGLQHLTKHPDSTGRKHPDTTWMKRGPLMLRTLGRAEVVYGLNVWNPDRKTKPITRTHHVHPEPVVHPKLTQDPHARSKRYPYLKGGLLTFRFKGPQKFNIVRRDKLTSRLTPPTEGPLHFNQPMYLAQHALYHLVHRDPTWESLYRRLHAANWDPSHVYQFCAFGVFQQCVFSNRNFFCLLSLEKRNVPGCCLAASFVLATPPANSEEVNTDLEADPSTCLVPYVIDHFVRFVWLPDDEDTHKEACAVVKLAVCCRLEGVYDDSYGEPMWKIQQPAGVDWAKNGELLELDRLKRQLIVVEPRDGNSECALERTWVMLGFKNSALDGTALGGPSRAAASEQNWP